MLYLGGVQFAQNTVFNLNGIFSSLILDKDFRKELSNSTFISH